LNKRTAADQLRYKRPISIIKEKLKEMNVVPETDIRVYPLYPFGWYSTVGANDRVYVLSCVRGVIELEIQPVYGFRPDGSLIIK